MENRRVNKRFKLHQMVEISYTNEEIFINAKTLNISTGGMHFVVKNRIDTVSDIFLMFEIPTGSKTHIIKCYGELAWQKEVDNQIHIGIEFQNMYKDDVKLLAQYIETLDEDDN